jgi:hypothetical protein
LAVKKIRITKAQFLSGLTSYIRAGIAAALALYLSGNTDPQSIGFAFLAAFAGPIIKMIDPTDNTIGVSASTDSTDTPSA